MSIKSLTGLLSGLGLGALSGFCWQIGMKRKNNVRCNSERNSSIMCTEWISHNVRSHTDPSTTLTTGERTHLVGTITIVFARAGPVPGLDSSYQEYEERNTWVIQLRVVHTLYNMLCHVYLLIGMHQLTRPPPPRPPPSSSPFLNSSTAMATAFSMTPSRFSREVTTSDDGSCENTTRKDKETKR